MFKSCNLCAECCKIVPPAIFNYELSKFKNKIVKVNTKKGTIYLLTKKENNECIFLEKNKCKIYDQRPFNCRLFPLDIKKIKKEYYWILWKFCYIPHNIEEILKNFEKKYIQKISKKELDIYILHRKFKIF